jgi:hypothetical protein
MISPTGDISPLLALPSAKIDNRSADLWWLLLNEKKVVWFTQDITLEPFFSLPYLLSILPTFFQHRPQTSSFDHSNFNGQQSTANNPQNSKLAP